MENNLISFSVYQYVLFKRIWVIVIYRKNRGNYQPMLLITQKCVNVCFTSI